MFNWVGLAEKIPTVASPVHKLTFKEKAKWTLIILVMFFVLGSITIWGINPDAVAQFEFLEIVFGSKFGSLISLGIGPIVTSSIILQLIVGSGIINWDQTTEEGKKKFSAAQKLMTISPGLKRCGKVFNLIMPTLLIFKSYPLFYKNGL